MAYIKIDGLSAVGGLLKKLPATIQARVIPAALNRAAAKGRIEMTRQITAAYQIKAADVRGSVRVIKSSRSKYEAVIDPFGGARKGRSMNLVHFVERKIGISEFNRRRAELLPGQIAKVLAGKKRARLSPQLRFKIKRAGGHVVIPGAFVGNKGRTIFQRVSGTTMPSRSGNKGRLHREQIAPVMTIGVPSMFNTRRINSAAIAKIRGNLPMEFDRAIKAALAGSLGGRR